MRIYDDPTLFGEFALKPWKGVVKGYKYTFSPLRSESCLGRLAERVKRATFFVLMVIASVSIAGVPFGLAIKGLSSLCSNRPQLPPPEESVEECPGFVRTNNHAFGTIQQMRDDGDCLFYAFTAFIMTQLGQRTSPADLREGALEQVRQGFRGVVQDGKLPEDSLEYHTLFDANIEPLVERKKGEQQKLELALNTLWNAAYFNDQNKYQNINANRANEFWNQYCQGFNPRNANDLEGKIKDVNAAIKSQILTLDPNPVTIHNTITPLLEVYYQMQALAHAFPNEDNPNKDYFLQRQGHCKNQQIDTIIDCQRALNQLTEEIAQKKQSLGTEGVRQYLEGMGRYQQDERPMGGGLEIQAICERFNMTAYVWTADIAGNNINGIGAKFNEGNGRQIVHLLKQGRHFNLFEPSEVAKGIFMPQEEGKHD